MKKKKQDAIFIRGRCKQSLKDRVRAYCDSDPRGELDESTLVRIAVQEFMDKHPTLTPSEDPRRVHGFSQDKPPDNKASSQKANPVDTLLGAIENVKNRRRPKQ